MHIYMDVMFCLIRAKMDVDPFAKKTKTVYFLRAAIRQYLSESAEKPFRLQRSGLFYSFPGCPAPENERLPERRNPAEKHHTQNDIRMLCLGKRKNRISGKLRALISTPGRR